MVASDANNVLYDFLYRRRPDGQVMPAGDVNPERGASPSYSLPAMLAYSYYKDPYLAGEYQRKPRVENHCMIFDILWRDLDIEPAPVETLPLTRYSGTPFGWMIARTGWDENSVIAEMKINEKHVGNHQHLDAGSFQIYYRGPLAIDSGTYQGSSGGYNSPHNKNYFKRTIAHNSLLVYDPDEKFECWNYGGGDKTEYAANDGGQRMPGDRWDTCRSFEDLLGESYTVGKALAHDFGPDRNVPEYSYLKGDITDAYSDKVREVKRSFVFINLNDTADSSARIPATLIVFDKVVSSDPGFRKYWLLHSIEEPVIENNTFTVDRTLNGDSGRLHDTVLLPEPGNAEISKDFPVKSNIVLTGFMGSGKSSLGKLIAGEYAFGLTDTDSLIESKYGKISDIFAAQGITQALPAVGLEQLFDRTLEQIRTAPDNTIIFPNFVNFDMDWGHRRNVSGYAAGLEYFDSRLPELFAEMKEGDIYFITADHGCDPTFKGTDHTREHVPVIMFGKGIAPRYIGRRETYADIGQTIADYFGLEPFENGKSFLK